MRTKESQTMRHNGANGANDQIRCPAGFAFYGSEGFGGSAGSADLFVIPSLAMAR